LCRPRLEEIAMKRTLTALVAAVTIAFAAVAAPTDASARDGGAVAAGIIGGIAAGAIIGSAVAAPPPPPVYYAPAPVYVEPAPVYGPECRIQRERFWDGYGWRSRRVEVCD
jgi:hypothetical protein